MTRRIVLVLGMHRSGSSLVTAGLQCLGVSLGDRLMAPAADNPKGFFENVDIVQLDDYVLQARGSTWDSELGIYPRRGDETMLQRTAMHYLDLCLSRWPLFGMKEPRMCRLLDFWRPAFREIKAEVSCLYVVRNPLEVARSLERRNALSLTHGLSLWYDHVSRSLEGVDPFWPRAVVRYDDMLTNPVGELWRIGRALKLSLDETAALRFADEFVDSGLRHHKSLTGGDLPRHIADLWHKMLTMTEKESA